jgi:hypothetical protein
VIDGIEQDSLLSFQQADKLTKDNVIQYFIVLIRGDPHKGKISDGFKYQAEMTYITSKSAVDSSAGRIAVYWRTQILN